MKKILLLIFITIYAYSGYQLEIPLNKKIFIGFSAPYTKDNHTYQTMFPYSANKININPTKIAILDALDMNISDNNITKILQNNFDTKNIQKHDDFKYSHITINVSHFDIKTGKYLQYSSKNISSSSNTLTHFEVGKGYYISINSTNSTDKVGIIAGVNFRLNASSLPVKRAGWHMLSFNDDVLSQSSSAIFIPYAVKTFSLSGVDGEYLFNVSFSTNARESARNINHEVRKKRNSGYPLYMVAYPAQQILNGVSIDGVIVVSDTLIETSNANATSISSRPLAFGKRSLQEHIVAFKFNDKNLTYPSQISITDTKTREATIPLTMGATVDQHIQSIDSNLQSIAQKSYGVYKVDGDFNATSSSYDYVLIAIDVAFGIKEDVTIKSYKKTSDVGKFQVRGVTTKRVNKISDIPKTTPDTKIYLVDNNSTFHIASVETNNIYILEEGSESINPTTNEEKGYITSFYKDINLFNSKFTNNNDDILDANEGYHSFYSPYFNDLKNKYSFSRAINHSQTLSFFNSLKYRAASFYTLNISKNSWLYATIDNLSRQDSISNSPSPMGSIYKEKGYFVYLEESNSKTLSQKAIQNTCFVTNHFNNSGDLKTHNSVTCNYSFSVNSLVSSGNIYTAIFILNNIAYEVIEKNGKFDFSVNDQDFNLDPTKDYPITIAILDSEGNQAKSNLFIFHYKKPQAPKNLQTNEVFISNNTVVYSKYISDVDTSKNKIGEGVKYAESEQLSWSNLSGGKIELLAVNKDEKGLYSDIVKFDYYPFLDPSTAYVDHNNKSNKLIQLNPYNNELKLYFQPIKNATFIGSFKTMYVKTSNKLLAAITYDPRYSDDTFYIEHDSHLYKGVFDSKSKYNSDSTPYSLLKIK